MVIQTESLGKCYGRFVALSDCNLEVQEGEVFGLLGPNGAGKTTLLRLLLGFLRPTQGRAMIAGLDCHRQRVQVHHHVTYLPGDARMFRGMRGRDALKFFASIRPDGDLRRSCALAERLELDLSRRVGFMSTGMRQKLALCATLSAQAPLIILDEPTANLDPSMRSEVIQIVMEARTEGRTVVFSSHVLSEVEESCDRVVILRDGKLVHTQVMPDLRRSHRIYVNLGLDQLHVPGEFQDHLSVSGNGSGNYTLETPDALAPLMQWLATLPLEEIRVEPIGLRAVYDRYHRI